MTIKNGEVYINGVKTTDPNIIGNYILHEATEAEQNEINFRSSIRELITAHEELTQLSNYMNDEKIDELFCKAPQVDYPFEVKYASTAQLIRLCEAYKNGLLTINKTK